jgi:hypothetical protein
VTDKGDQERLEKSWFERQGKSFSIDQQLPDNNRQSHHELSSTFPIFDSASLPHSRGNNPENLYGEKDQSDLHIPLQDASQAKAWNTNGNEAGRRGRRILATSSNIFALVVDNIANQGGATVEETNTIRIGAGGAKQTGKRDETARDDVGVLNRGDLVAAGELIIRAALSLSLIDSHVIGDSEAVLIIFAFALAFVLARSLSARA